MTLYCTLLYKSYTCCIYFIWLSTWTKNLYHLKCIISLIVLVVSLVLITYIILWYTLQQILLQIHFVPLVLSNVKSLITYRLKTLYCALQLYTSLKTYFVSLFILYVKSLINYYSVRPYIKFCSTNQLAAAPATYTCV